MRRRAISENFPAARSASSRNKAIAGLKNSSIGVLIDLESFVDLPDVFGEKPASTLGFRVV